MTCRSRTSSRTVVLLLVALACQPVQADDSDLDTRLKALQQTVERQQAQLDAQREQMEAQLELIRQLQAGQKSSATVVAADPPTGSPAGSDEATTGSPVVSASAGEAASPSASDGQQAAVAELQRREIEGTADLPVNAQATLYDPSSSIFDPNFPGAWHLPGTTAAMKIGGYVSLAVIDSRDPIGSSDGFVVGTIPPDGVDFPDASDGTKVTAGQSRMNLEIREQTTYGQLRAFVEGDFMGSGDTFRLRHAYGQYAWALAGKTWSVFANVDALPEQVDFEGISGAVLVRQAQLRVFPRLAEEYSLVVSIEDPQTDIENGTGEPGSGDIILSFDRLPLGESRDRNYKVGMILRDLQGNESVDGSESPSGKWPTKTATGWGITTSGRLSSPFRAETDLIRWQLTYGEGIGRYLNDLGSVGGGDAVFAPNGSLRPLPVFAGFLSYQHEWTERFKFMSTWPGLLRSNLNVSWVDIDNYSFQDDLSYNSTLYTSINLIYFPTQNARFGVEYLWGQRTNKDGSSGSASQIQLSSRFSF